MAAECPVCLDETSEYQTPCCKKVYHVECFDKSLRLNGMCPTCRAPFVIVTIHGDLPEPVEPRYSRAFVLLGCIVTVATVVYFVTPYLP